MKNLRSGLYILALVTLICVFVPGSALAQDPGDDPCCHRAPTGVTTLDIGIIQGEIQLFKSFNFDRAVSGRLNSTSIPAPERMSLAAIALAKEESWMPGYRRQS
jgi:hypothetical protein